MANKSQAATRAADNPLEAIDEAESEHHGVDSSVGGEDRPNNDLNQLAQADTKQIRIWKHMVVLFIAIAGAAVSVGINIYLKVQQEQEIDDNVSETL